MKLNTVLLFLLLILSIKTESKLDSFSIEKFRDYLKGNGLFEIIKLIKETYGQDIAIISCEELNKKNKGNCKKLVTEYMDNDETPRPTSNPALKKIECAKGFYSSPYIKQSNSNSAIKEILGRKFNENQIYLILKKIIKRVCIK